ncbi:MAG: L,D-transpeptidase family protein [Saprospiraceae bacterium]
MQKHLPPTLAVLGFLLITLSLTSSRPAPGIFSDCGQLVVVLAPADTSVNAQLWRFEKIGQKWHPVGQANAVNLGKKGLAWGRGLQSAKPGLQKKEGDQKSPKGIFRFGAAFGYAPAGQLPLKLPYIAITENQLCIEDDGSRYYNQIVDASRLPKDWKSKEYMLRPDNQYKWGIFVLQNLPPKDAAGSCIFFHLWRAPGSGTLGCTAMTEPNLLALLQWLDPGKKPLLMQMTTADYADYRPKFGLPTL